LGPSVVFLSAGLQLLAAALAYRCIRSIRFHWGWVLLFVALLLQGLRRILVGIELSLSGEPLPSTEWITLFISGLFFAGLIGLSRLLADHRREAACLAAEVARAQAERERDTLRDQHQLAFQEHQEFLRHSSELSRLLETVIDTADVWINTLDLEASVVLWNRAAESISGYGREEVQGCSDVWEKLYPEPAYRAEIAQKVAVILKGQETVRDFETTIRTKTGENRIISWSSKNLSNEHGDISGSLAIGRDVTELRKTEAEYKRVHTLQNLILEHNVLGIAFVQDRKIVWANPRAAAMRGMPLDEFIGAPSRIIYPDEAIYEEMGQKAYQIMVQGGVFDTRLQMKRGSGQYFWCRLVGMAVYPSNPHAGSIWLAEDISKQVAAETALAESEARFRGAFEGTQDAILLLTMDGIFDCNQRALDLFGFSHKSEMLRLHPADLSPVRQPDGEDSRGSAVKHIQQALREGSVQFGWQHRRQNGELFPADILLSSFKMGRRKVIQACVRDISGRLAAEEAARASETRFRMLFDRYADAVLLLETRTNEFVDCNQAALDMLHCSQEELKQFSPVDFSPPFQPDGSSSREKGLEMLSIAIKNGSHRFHWVHRSPHRSDFTVDVLLTAIQSGPSPLVFATWREILPD
jgi:PAS domain S-box-containing protein